MIITKLICTTVVLSRQLLVLNSLQNFIKIRQACAWLLGYMDGRTCGVSV